MGGGRVGEGGRGAHAPARAVTGGRVRDGRGLTPFLRDAVEDARARPSPFASLRNLVAEEDSALAGEPMPGHLRDTQPGGGGRA
eukprot:201204-Pleurochrysis_carterae.AAC.1